MDTALFPNKAMSRGAKALLEDVYAFKFRPSADERFKDIQEREDMGGFFVPPAMLRYHASAPTIRRAIAEYEDGLKEPINNGEERVSGYYTQAEYDDINRSSAYYDNYDDYN